MSANGVVKFNYIFSGPEHGWRETWYVKVTSPNLDTAMTGFETTLAARRVLLGAECSIKATEASVEFDDEGVPVLNDSYIKNQNAQGYQSEASADLDIDLVTTCYTVTRQRRRYCHMRGIWDSIEVQGGKFLVPQGSTWTTKFNSWRDAMIGLGAGWVTSIKSVPFNISTVTQLAGGQVRIVFAAPGPWEVKIPTRPVQIRINTNRQPSALSGKQVVVVEDATTCVVQPRMAILPVAPIGWRAYTYTFDFSQIKFMDQYRIGRRATGRPLLVGPGRRKGRSKV